VAAAAAPGSGSCTTILFRGKKNLKKSFREKKRWVPSAQQEQSTKKVVQKQGSKEK
jgi:hypothetical protein